MEILGINLGNASCRVVEAKHRDCEPHPNVMCIPKGKFGDEFLYKISTKHIQNRASQAMRLLGYKFSDPELQSELGFLPFKVIEGPDGCPLIHGIRKDRAFTPIEILAMLISHLLMFEKDPKSHDSYKIAIPTYFTDQQRQHMLEAAKIAGLTSPILLDETTAIAKAYTRAWSFQSVRIHFRYPRYNVAFVDIGHAAMQVCFAAVHGEINIFYKAYMRSVGGRDFDIMLFKHFAGKIKREYNIDVYQNAHDCVHLLEACEGLKKDLSKCDEASFCIKFSNKKDVKVSIKREVFENMATPILNKIKAALQKALQNSGLNMEEPLFVEAVGNGCSVPAIINIMREVFRTEPRKMTCSDEYVVRGCAVQFEAPELCYLEPKVNLKTTGAANLESVSEELLFEGKNGEYSDKFLWIKAMEKQGHSLISLNHNINNISGQKIALINKGNKSNLFWKAWNWRAQTKTLQNIEPDNQNEERSTLTCENSEAQRPSGEQLESERHITGREEELHELNEETPVSQCVGYFAEFSYSELKDATNNFHPSFKLGQGGFGIVYKGILHKTAVAIKILKDRSSQGTKEFNMEVEILSKVRHPNLVTLVGACAETRALIYEYLPNGSLEDRLRCKNNTPPLSWQNRVRIAFEICSALNFLHCTKPHGIAHGDLKPDNILLDSNNVSKISDFGLSRQLNYTDSASVPFHETDCPKGTLAYMDPEYFTTWKMTPQFDIYAFGIILLRMVTGKDPRGIRILVVEAQKKGKVKTLIDSSAGAWPFEEATKMISLGLRCSDPVRKNRPNLSTQVWSEIKSMVDVASASAPSLFSRLFHRHH